MKNKVENVWFKKWGWLYRPINIIGLTLCLATVFIVVWIFIAVDRRSHSVSDTLIGFFLGLGWQLLHLVGLLPIQANKFVQSLSHLNYVR